MKLNVSCSPAKHFEMEEDWEGALYCGIWLKWNYSKRCTDMKMPGCVIFSLERFKLSKSTKKQDCTKEPYPQKYGSAAQSESVNPVNNYSLLRPLDINWIQHIIGCFLYYVWALDAKNALGMKYHCEWTSCTYRTNKTMYQTLIRLQMDPPQNYHPCWQIQHDS